MSMGIVGVKSTAGREVKFIDPSKTTRSESAWLGYSLCDFVFLFITFFFLTLNFLSFITHFKSKKVFSFLNKIVLKVKLYLSLYNEERRLGVQRGSDTLVVPLFTSNDGLSIAFKINVP